VGKRREFLQQSWQKVVINFSPPYERGIFPSERVNTRLPFQKPLTAWGRLQEELLTGISKAYSACFFFAAICDSHGDDN
jgi:hypothetical protein